MVAEIFKEELFYGGLPYRSSASCRRLIRRASIQRENIAACQHARNDAPGKSLPAIVFLAKPTNLTGAPENLLIERAAPPARIAVNFVCSTRSAQPLVNFTGRAHRVLAIMRRR